VEACRRNLAQAVEDWLLFSVAKALPIPDLGDVSICPIRIVLTSALLS